MSLHTSPEVVVQRQLEAYNSKNMDAWLATYAADAKQFELGGALLAEGHTAIRARTESRFTEDHLQARLIRREVFGSVVVDHEDVTRTIEGQAMRIELVCVYQVENGLIQTASFSMGPLMRSLID
ncbi:hypothetical protein B9Z52_05075 [Limnohabitans sp. Jir72]|nr:nuclear transport factor 2 family protein [Limnohabitans sp. Jir72]PUE34504.1 hypothetical protein B9Z52_05075 [Limnohabitans sp. Jir72]